MSLEGKINLDNFRTNSSSVSPIIILSGESFLNVFPIDQTKTTGENLIFCLINCIFFILQVKIKKKLDFRETNFQSLPHLVLFQKTSLRRNSNIQKKMNQFTKSFDSPYLISFFIIDDMQLPIAVMILFTL